MNLRVGNGYDTNTNLVLVVAFILEEQKFHELGLLGHSDADVLMQLWMQC